jgi:hypothetical protein
MTKAEMQAAFEKIRLLAGAEIPDAIMLKPWQYRVMIIESVGPGGLDHWEAWKLLYNAGFRGRALNDFRWNGCV